MIKKIIVCSCIVSVYAVFTQNTQTVQEDLLDRQHYYVTPSDERFFDHLKNLIGSIHRFDAKNLGEIAVFDLGMTAAQRAELNTMWKVHVYDVEMVHPQLLEPFVTAPWGRVARGYFAWKPVLMKQALDMFPYFFYLDAGISILRSMEDLFAHIREQGYFLLSCGDFKQPEPHLNIVNRITKKVLNDIVYKLDPAVQNKILDDTTIEISAGIQGIARWNTKVVNEYLMPVYEHAKDLAYFEDDGSAKYGYGHGRHDQILFSVYAHALGLTIFPQGWSKFQLSTGDKPVHIHSSLIYENASLLLFRGGIKYKGGYLQFIKYR